MIQTYTVADRWQEGVEAGEQGTDELLSEDDRRNDPEFMDGYASSFEELEFWPERPVNLHSEVRLPDGTSKPFGECTGAELASGVEHLKRLVEEILNS